MATGERTRSAATGADRAVEAVASIHARLADTGWDLPVRLWTGQRLGPEDASFRLVLHAPESLRAMLVPGTDLAVGEAYLDGWFEVEGSMVAAMRVVADLHGGALGFLDRLGMAGDVLRLPSPGRRSGTAGARRRGRTHSRRRDREVVSHHYDVGNDFYRLFLDEGLVYSCGYFTSDDLAAPPHRARPDALETAQRRKLDLVCRKLGLRDGQRLLDVGCGWGAMVVHAARTYGVRAVGVTLSQEQADLARRRVADAGLGDRVEIRVQDYRDVDEPFDAISSIGMVEHVGTRHLPAYFEHLFTLTRDGGRLLNHGITTGRRQEPRDFALTEDDSFVGTHVFPDSALVPSSVMVGHAEAAGFEVADLHQLRPHYARTLHHWVHRLERNADRVREVASERTLRTWRAYMAGSAVGFESGDLGVVQLLCSKGADLPAGRPWLLLD